MSRFLEEMASRSIARLEDARGRVPAAALEESLGSASSPRPLGRFGLDFDVIAEVKPRSPSEGRFPRRDPVATASAYESGGAAMLSVLTEPSEFGGSLTALSRVSASSGIPVMAKDFLVDIYQVLQARVAGADGVLVIVRMLDDETMASILATAARLGMFCLLEAFDAADLSRIGELGATRPRVLAGVNCRDLVTLEVKPGRHLELAGLLPEGLVAVAESGIETGDDVERAAAAGYVAVLVGSALMRSDDPGALLGSLRAAGRASRVGLA
jgi:indole-3-glycerol phosphate synthase